MIMKKTFKKILPAIFFFTPMIAFACDIPRDISTLFDYGLCVLSGSVVPFLLGLGMIIFLVGVVGYVRAGDNE